MRVTNPMVSNMMQLNINRNMRNIDNLYNQLATGKRVTFPSDNPILAGRALKFRTSVYETEQYQRNVTQGLSWMDVSEGAFKNVLNITSSIRELLVQGASDENSYEDRLKIIADIEQKVQQLSAEMNISYAGRYVFSGYRTDEPPVFQKENSESFTINQSFAGVDIEKMDVVQSASATSSGGGNYSELGLHSGIDVLKLAYPSGIDDGTLGLELVAADGTLVMPQPQIIEVDSIDMLDGSIHPALDNLDPDTVYFIKDSSTLLLGSNVVYEMRVGGSQLNATYDKTGFEKGDLNPKVYFDCVDRAPGGKTYNMNSQSIEYEFGTSTRIAVNSLAKDVYTDKMYADLMDFCNTLSGVSTNTLESLMASGLTEEEANLVLHDEQDVLRKMSQTRFNSMLGILDTHITNVTKQHTDLGSRMSRLELIENRLAEDLVNYKGLLSDNEDVDYTEAAMELNTAESIYQASLQVGARIIQITLADYIR